MVTPAQIATIPFLKDVSGGALRDIAKHAIWYCVPSGSALFLDQEPAEAIWFVLSGSLGAFRPSQMGKMEFVGHIRHGEPVGEFALLANEPHSGAVYALRDSEVLALDRAVFNRLIRRHPDLMANLARTVLFRSRQNRRKNPRSDPRVFALIGASFSLDMKARANSLVEALAKLGKKALIVGAEAQFFNSAWFDQAERENDLVLLLSQNNSDSWSHICRRRADRIWIFGRGDLRPEETNSRAHLSPIETFQLIDIVLVNAAASRATTQTKAWIEAYSPDRVFHWQENDPNALAVLARVLAGKTLGLVLGGGGARAYAQIGALRALREAGLVFDFVGGTSMGGVVAACFAMGWSDGEIERRIMEAFVRNSPLDDYILPVVALTKGRKVDQRLAYHFGDMAIEDLRTPFFCVSSNLSTGSPYIHTTGLLRHALRASIALPGILPPIVFDDGVHVDGAVLDNFPVAAMRDRHRGFNIGIDVAQEHKLRPEDFLHPPNFMGWVSRYGFKRAPPIIELLMRAATAHSQPTGSPTVPDFLIMPELEGIQLRDWKAFDRAVEAGYLAAVRALKSAPAIFR
jgi:NTE family protein